MNDAEAFAWMKLAHLGSRLNAERMLLLRERLTQHGIGLERVFRMGEKAFGARFPEFCDPSFSKIQQASFREICPDAVQTLAALFHTLADKATLLYPTHPLFPNKLLQQPDGKHPSLLYAVGHPEILQARSVAVVGGRRSDRFTLGLTEHLAAALTERGFNILSGLANGVDSAAHRGAVLADGTTTLVLPRGILSYCPKPELVRLANWERNHVAISPFHPWAVSRKRNFLIRNRLLVRLSEAVVVMDAGNGQTGTAATARFALRQGVPVYVLHPKVLPGRATGNTDLICAGGIEFGNGKELIARLLRPVASVI